MVPLVPVGAVGAVGASWCRWCRWCQLVPLVPRFPSNLARFRGFPEMLTTSCFPGSHLVPKTPQNSPKTPFLTRNGTKKQTGSPQRKPEAQGNTRKALYTTGLFCQIFFLVKIIDVNLIMKVIQVF